MLINFNLPRLDELLLDFYKITGLTISIWDADLRQLSFQPKEMAPFCKLIKSCRLGAIRCYNSDKLICSLAKEQKKPVTHICHAGLMDTAVPLIFKDEILGYILFGQMIDRDYKKLETAEFEKLAQELSLDEKLLKENYDKLSETSRDTISSAANIMKLATRYLWLSNMIEISSNTLAGEIDSYIDENITKNISVELLCKQFHISKNKLYSLFKEKFNCTIMTHVTNKRMELAKNLLVSTDTTIHEISVSIGIPDYNYFTKVFKKNFGMSPLKYRKTRDGRY